MLVWSEGGVGWAVFFSKERRKTDDFFLFMWPYPCVYVVAAGVVGFHHTNNAVRLNSSSSFPYASRTGR